MPDLPPLREVIDRHGLRARKSLGQNFLLDQNLTDKIVRAVGPLDGLTVVEVGPGPGGLTRSLLQSGAEKIVALERDPRCLPALAELSTAYPGRLKILEQDALTVDWGQLVSGPAAIVANLPYNIATPLLTGWLCSEPWPPWYTSMTLMFQKEVADRIRAKPGSRTYGRLSVISQWRCTVEHRFDIPARAFTPPPKVDSTVVGFTPRASPAPACERASLERVTQAAFGQRRKMLRSSLKSLGVEVSALLHASGLAGDIRAEQIDVAGFCRLAACLDALDTGR